METAELETLLAVREEWMLTEKDPFIISQLQQAQAHDSNIYFHITGRMWTEDGATMTEVEAEEPSGINHHN